MNNVPTLKQRNFVNAYVENGGNATQAALKAYKTTLRTANNIGSDNLRKPSVRALLESYATPITKHIRKLATNAKSEYVQLEASKDILDRAGYKAIERTESVQINVTLSGTLAAKRQINNAPSDS